jgi:O-acetyl-ADP-ribose deacetylase (regulator of RNase III)
MQIQLLRADISSLKVDAIVSASETGDQHVSGGNLLCKFVIHTPVPRPEDEDVEEQLRRATLASLERAEELEVNSVAMPAMCTGFSDQRCAEIMLETTLDFGRRAQSLQRVVYCLFGEGVYEVFDRVLRDLKR